MPRVFVENWAPDYGSSFDVDPDLADFDKVDETVEEAGPWSPRPGHDDGVEIVAFVDGVRRIDARLVLDDLTGPIPGICGTFAVGCVRWERTVPRSVFGSTRVERVAVFGSGHAAPLPSPSPRIAYRTESVVSTDPGALIQHFHGAMRKAEAELSEKVARDGVFVVADGPINDLSATEKIGYIKSHRAPYVSEKNAAVIGALEPGERTPLFLIGSPDAGGSAKYPRYSWYLRLARAPRSHSWAGIARAEVSSHLGIDAAVRVADRAAALLPKVASEPHIDPRAPQNLVPIAALERELRRRMGDPGFIVRELRAATAEVTT